MKRTNTLSRYSFIMGSSGRYDKLLNIVCIKVVRALGSPKLRLENRGNGKIQPSRWKQQSGYMRLHHYGALVTRGQGIGDVIRKGQKRNYSALQSISTLQACQRRYSWMPAHRPCRLTFQAAGRGQLGP